MSASMRNFMEAYEAVHNKEVRDEFYKNQDELSSMNIGRLTDNDLREISEQICEHLFSEGASVSEAEFIISELFSETEIVGRQKKAERILDAFAEAFKRIKSKSTDVALESFARYRKNKKLQETWSVRFNQEKRVQRAHGTSVADEVASVKSGLLSMIEGKMPEGLRKYMEKKGKGHSKGEDKSDSKGGGKPDFLDLDKDGDKKESMKKAAKDKKMKGVPKEGFDAFDTVLEYLQVEGIAESFEDAQWMMVNLLDEEDINSILDEARRADKEGYARGTTENPKRKDISHGDPSQRSMLHSKLKRRADEMGRERRSSASYKAGMRPPVPKKEKAFLQAVTRTAGQVAQPNVPDTGRHKKS